MLCFWGAQVREGFGLEQPDKVKHGNSGIRSVCPKSKVQDMSAGRSFVGFIRDGQVSVLRLRSEDCDHDGKLKHLQLKNDRIRLIVCGGDGAVLLAYGGKVLIMDKSTVCRLNYIIQCYCGCCVSHDKHDEAMTNVLFCTTDRHVPTVVNSLNQKKIVSISCGGEHTATLSKGGTVFTFGSGGSGQLGHKSFKDEHHPRVVAELWGSEVSQVTCGRHHTLVSVASSKLIYSFGCWMQGKLGNCKMIKKSVPFPYLLHTECNHEYTIEKLIAGENHSFALFFKELGNESAKSKPNPIRGVLTLNDRMIDRWVSERDSWLPFSFMSVYEIHLSCISQVVMVVQQMLRSLNPSPFGEESLRLYILLPELIRRLQKQQRTELTEALASKILELNPAVRKVLEKYWSRLPDDCLKSLVKLFRKASAEMIGQISRGEMNQDTQHLENFMQILQMIYQVIIVGIIQILFKFPFAADTVSKWRMFRYLRDERIQSSRDRFILNDNMNKLLINRESVLMDTLEYLRQDIHLFFHQLEVVFIGENGIDMRGLSAEFFSLLSQSLLKWEKKVLEVHESSLVWFNPDGMQDDSDFYYLGVICGMALYNHHYINLDFPLALYKKLLQLSPTLNDLEDLSPVEARSLKSLLEEDEDEVVDMLFLDFTVKGQELIPNGNQIPVTKSNRSHKQLCSVKNQFEHFSRGFFKGCPLDFWRMFHPEELQELLHGSPKYEWKELQQCASYEKCSASDQLIKNFWTVFFEFTEENKRKFLIFMYGTDRVPVEGFSKRSLKISQSDCPDAEDRLPEAQTCFGKFILPKYSDINTLRDKLMHAISFCEVFGRG
uniref:HECT domain-containing protein n=1 Tax=Sinocyclocheilus anshuiensis TaxID=1608454 RepID=A0A671SLF5_9TELE